MTVSSFDSPNHTNNHARALAKYLEGAGARIEYDEAFEHKYGLQFTVTRLQHVFAHVNLGVHLTTSPEDFQNMSLFAQTSKRGLVLKSIYIELDEETIQAGGLLIAFGACLSFLFDKRHQHTKLIGLRINEDCSFNFFDIDEATQRLQRMDINQDIQIGQNLLGRIIAYFTDKGFGFIQTDDDRKYFFHIANIVDDDLRTKLPAYVPGEIIPVEFQYGGNDGKKYPKAINVSSEP